MSVAPRTVKRVEPEVSDTLLYSATNLKSLRQHNKEKSHFTVYFSRMCGLSLGTLLPPPPEWGLLCTEPHPGHVCYFCLGPGSLCVAQVASSHMSTDSLKWAHRWCDVCPAFSVSVEDFLSPCKSIVFRLDGFQGIRRSVKLFATMKWTVDTSGDFLSA